MEGVMVYSSTLTGVTEKNYEYRSQFSLFRGLGLNPVQAVYESDVLFHSMLL